MTQDDLDDLLAQLTPAAQRLAYGNRHDNARASFVFPKAKAGSEAEFDAAIAAYVQHHEQQTAGRSLSVDEALYMAEELLRNSLYREGGLDAAREMGLNGEMEGGMTHIFTVLAEGMKARAAAIYIRSVFGKYVSPTDFDQRETCLAALESRMQSTWPSVSTNTRVRMIQQVEQAFVSVAQMPENLLRLRRH